MVSDITLFKKHKNAYFGKFSDAASNINKILTICSNILFLTVKMYYNTSKFFCLLIKMKNNYLLIEYINIKQLYFVFLNLPFYVIILIFFTICTIVYSF